jgi:hypothetical protein
MLEATLLLWDARTPLPHLSVYLAHISPEETYWPALHR